MNANIITITRKTRAGADWRTVTNEDNEPCPKPLYTGTVNTVLRKLEEGKTLASLGGVFKRVDWFIKVDGQWKRIEPVNMWDHISRLDIENEMDVRIVED